MGVYSSTWIDEKRLIVLYKYEEEKGWTSGSVGILVQELVDDWMSLKSLEIESNFETWRNRDCQWMVVEIQSKKQSILSLARRAGQDGYGKFCTEKVNPWTDGSWACRIDWMVKEKNHVEVNCVENGNFLFLWMSLNWQWNECVSVWKLHGWLGRNSW